MSSKFIRPAIFLLFFMFLFLVAPISQSVKASSPSDVAAPTAVSCVDFSAFSPGTSVEGLGAVHPDLNIGSSGDASVIYDGQTPSNYGSSDGINGGLGVLQGFADLTKAHQYEFSFGPDQAVSFFSIRMLDYGDLNKAAATEHEVALQAYDINGFLVAESSLVFTSDSSNNPTSGSAGDLQITGDATAELGQPGNFAFSVFGTGITRLVIDYSSDGVTSVTDPNHGLADLCFELEGEFDFPEATECVDFNEVAPGESVEGLGVVNQYLDISSSTGNAVAVAEGVLPGAYGSLSGVNYGMGALSGFVDTDKIHEYSFTFAPDVSVNFFTVRMLDYGDLNKILATDHLVTLEAYDSDGFLITSSQLSFKTDPVFNPTSSTAGNLQFTGDATAALGNPGNFIFAVGGEDIVRLELKYSTDLGEGASDPNHGLAILCFAPNLPEPELDPPTAVLELLRPKQAPEVGGKYLVEYACSETAPNLVSATINGYDVVSGQEVNLVVRENESARVINDLLIWLFAPEFSLDVTCADDSGNEVSTSVMPEFDTP